MLTLESKTKINLFAFSLWKTKIVFINFFNEVVVIFSIESDS